MSIRRRWLLVPLALGVFCLIYLVLEGWLDLSLLDYYRDVEELADPNSQHPQGAQPNQ